ncbi:12467_t:CDS:2, partial [Rhizophagus irregularis]
MSELYPGHKVLESYFKEKGHFASYYGFLLLHQNTIVASSLPANNWKELNNCWTNHFLKEAKYYEKDLISIKEK